MLDNRLNSNNQIILVVCKEYKANLIMLKKEGKRWIRLLSTQAFIGKNGIGKKQEADGKTPKGLYKMGIAFGINKNPRNYYAIYTNR